MYHKSINIKGDDRMGKFSKPRNTQWHGRDEETMILPKVTPAPETDAADDVFDDALLDITASKVQPPVTVPPVQPTPAPEIDEDDDMFEDERRNFSGKNRKIVFISICSVAAALLIGLVAVVGFMLGKDPNDGKILNNVFVAGVNLGNMTREEAEAALHRATDLTYTVEDMVVELPDTIITFSPKDTGIKLDIEAAVQAAFDYGRVGTREEKKQALENSMNTEHPIALLPYLNLNVDLIRSQLDAYGKEFNSDFQQVSVTTEGTRPILDASEDGFDPKAPGQTLVINVGKPGRYVDITKVYNQVLDAYSFNRFLVKIEMDHEETMPEAVDLQELYDLYYEAPVNAVVDSENDAVTHERYGYGFDLANAQAILDEAHYGDTVRIPLEMIPPELNGELMFRDVLGAFQTEHTTNEKRNTNLRLACEAVNGTILNPGDVFDFNTVVGKRTKEKGYQAAAAYDGGKTVQTLGGGICQVSSTIYYCVLLADLETIDRSPHSYVSSYMDPGTDATVSWGGPEFSFRNTTNYPIRIDAEVSDGYVKVQLVGTDEKDYYIKIEYEVLAYKAFDIVYEEYAPDNAEGYKDGQEIQSSYVGCNVQTYKCKYDKETNELISREKDQYSSYKSRDRIIAKVVEETEPPTDPDDNDTPEVDPTDPPADNPPAVDPTDPPADNPPTDNPPADTPPVDNPPADNPPADNPPADNPPAPPADGGETA